MADQVPADWQDKVMHGSLTVGGQVLMGGDVAPDRYEEPKGFSLSIQIKSTAEAERIFRDFASEGRVVMPLEKTFWADRFGIVVDRFGIQWLINCEGSISIRGVTWMGRDRIEILIGLPVWLVSDRGFSRLHGHRRVWNPGDRDVDSCGRYG